MCQILVSKAPTPPCQGKIVPATFLDHWLLNAAKQDPIVANSYSAMSCHKVSSHFVKNLFKLFILAIAGDAKYFYLKLPASVLPYLAMWKNLT